MPLKEVPSVRTLEEFYQIHEQHQLKNSTKKLSSDEQEQQRSIWFLGASAVILTLLTLRRDDGSDGSLDSLRTKVLEAWDAEIMDRAVAQAMAFEAAKRPDLPDGSEKPDRP
jgi:hypothetical protein